MVIALVYDYSMVVHPKKAFIVAFSILFFSIFFPVNPCPADIAVIKIHFRDASELLPLVETLLSLDGKAFVDTRTNSIVVRDSSESLRQIRAALAESDKAIEQVRIRFRFVQQNVSRERDISLSGRVSGERGSVAIGKRKRDGVSLHIGDREVNQRRNGEFFITVTSGGTAYIRVGKDVPYTERWVYLSRRYAHVVETVNVRSLETGFEVRPVVAGDHVHIDIVPRISYEESGKRGVIHFTEASTRLRVPRGEWIILGGDREESNEAIRDILTSGSTERNSTLSLSLMVEP
jgi:type II secretory pathway component GspD/PulD (secretin)